MTHSNEKLKEWLHTVAAATRTHGGVAARLPTLDLLPPEDAWGFPKYPARTAILPHDVDLFAALDIFVATNMLQLCDQDSCLGTWLHPHTNQYYIDVTTSCADLATAYQQARCISLEQGRKIVAVYNSARQETVYLWDDVRA